MLFDSMNGKDLRFPCKHFSLHAPSGSLDVDIRIITSMKTSRTSVETVNRHWMQLQIQLLNFKHDYISVRIR